MLMLDAIATSAATDSMAIERVALVKALDIGSLWQSCSALISKALPCHSCSLLFDIEGYQPQQGRHHLAETRDDGARLVTSLDVAALRALCEGSADGMPVGSFQGHDPYGYLFAQPRRFRR